MSTSVKPHEMGGNCFESISPVRLSRKLQKPIFQSVSFAKSEKFESNNCYVLLGVFIRQLGRTDNHPTAIPRGADHIPLQVHFEDNGE